MNSLAIIAEEQIKEAIANGEPERLAQSGHTVDMDDYFAAPSSLRAGFSFLANAGMAPPEVQAMSTVELLKKELTACTDPLRRRALQKLLAMRETELAMAMERIKQAIKFDATT